jgi:hypothetical protein
MEILNIIKIIVNEIVKIIEIITSISFIEICYDIKNLYCHIIIFQQQKSDELFDKNYIFGDTSNPKSILLVFKHPPHKTNSFFPLGNSRIIVDSFYLLILGGYYAT